MMVVYPCPVCTDGWRRLLEFLVGLNYCTVCSGAKVMYCHGDGREFHRIGIGIKPPPKPKKED